MYRNHRGPCHADGAKHVHLRFAIQRPETCFEENAWQPRPGVRDREWRQTPHEWLHWPHTWATSMYTLNSVMSTSMISLSLYIYIPKPRGTDVHSSNLTPYCHISLPCSTNFVSNANHQGSQPHTLTVLHVSICGVSSSSSSSSVTSWMLVRAYATSPGKTKWCGPHQWRWEENEFKFHSVKCYSITHPC